MNELNNILSQSISLFIIFPLLAFVASLFWQNRQEKPITMIVLFTKAFYILAALVYAILWLVSGYEPVSQHFITLYDTDHFVFAIQFYYDRVTAVYSVVGAVLFFLVSTFSRYYMHRDEGFKRFFNIILFFALGYNIIIFSGNFETLFIGWEIIGISSFLLIAFYRSRYLPVKNAFKTLSNYRLSDVAIMLAMWMMHHLTHQNISFTQLEEANLLGQQTGNQGMAYFIVVMLVLAAIIKSAQFPFTSWLPRAMEGPTASSAIFYGSLSVHIGAFVLLRTFPFWQDMLWIKLVIITIGVLTGIIGTLIARVQPTVKTQIAYSSAAQIGIIFIEIALGFHVLALIHFAGNAFLRTYQLLVSPSVLNYLVHHQYFHYHQPKQKIVAKWRSALYILGIKEWNLDSLLYTYLWSPFKWLGRQFQFLGSSLLMILLSLTGIALLVASFVQPALLRDENLVLPYILIGSALIMVLFAFAHRRSALTAWNYLLIAHLFIIAGIGSNSTDIASIELVFYASGVFVTYLLGVFCLQKTQARDQDISLNQFHGYVYEDKTSTLWFLISAVGMLGFPVTAAFIGIDVLFTYVGSGQIALVTMLALSFIFIELAAIRIFIRVYLGLHKKLDHPVAYRSS